jgi:hypothetical protein
MIFNESLGVAFSGCLTIRSERPFEDPSAFVGPDQVPKGDQLVHGTFVFSDIPMRPYDRIPVIALSVYPWKRFWYPRDGLVSLADDGFLVDPDSEHARYYQSDAVPFDAISNGKCLILLGEPGIGKSTALKAEFEKAKAAVAATGDAADWFDLRDDSSSADRLERKILGSDQVRRWQDSQNTLYLFLDSLDEGLLQIDNISGFLLSLLQKLPTPRMRLRIASRPLDWQVTLESGFIEIWGQDNVRAFQLAPLRKTDVAVAAESLRIEGKQFIDQVVSRDVVPFAIKPVTLKFLLGFFENSRPLPASRTELYYEGCKRLCEEENPHRRDSPKARGTLVPSQRMDIASRIAAVSQLSNRSAIWLGLSEGLQREDLSLESIVGGSEGEPNREVEVNLINARESLGTGLFSSRGLTRQGWQHQTYAEYLAAYYLDAHKLSLKTAAATYSPSGWLG